MSRPSRSWGRSLGWLVLVGLLGLGFLRAGCFLVYAAIESRAPLEAYHLEAKMVHLAWRVQHGVRLYPPWRDGPYVANFFGPGYFGLVGLLGHWTDAQLDELFTLGRVVTIGSAMFTASLLGAVAWHRWGRGPGISAAVLSLGAAPMIGFGVMVRPDTLADFLGLSGFLLAISRNRLAQAGGALSLGAALLTKQTTALYLGAAALALIVTGRWRAGVLLGVAVVLSLTALVGGVTWVVEPEFGPSLLAEGKTPWNWDQYVLLLNRSAILCPDLAFSVLMGLGLWTLGPRRDPPLAVLTVVLTLGSLIAAAKRGADLNYFLPLRAIEALAISDLWGVLRQIRGRRVWVLAGVSLLGLPGMALSGYHTYVQMIHADNQRQLVATPFSRDMSRQYKDLVRLARDPNVRLLTDRGLLDIQQEERTLYGDPWLFRMLVESGQIEPRMVRGKIEREEYDWIITTKPLDDPRYVTYDFGLPMPLVEAARRHYLPQGEASGMFVYGPRRELGTRIGSPP
jgi:hypothetical protein